MDMGVKLSSEDDVKTLEYLCTMTKINGHSLDETVKHIASLYRSKLTISDTATPLQDNPLVEFKSDRKNSTKEWQNGWNNSKKDSMKDTRHSLRHYGSR